MKEFSKKNMSSRSIDNLVQTLEYKRSGDVVIRWSKTERCRQIGESWGQFLAEAYSYYSHTFAIHPPSELLILSKADWVKVPHLSGQLYGNPVSPNNLILAGCGAPTSWKRWARTLLSHVKSEDVQELLRFFAVTTIDEAIHKYFSDELFKGWLAHELAHHFSNRLLMAVPKWKLALLSLLEGGPSRFIKKLMWIGEFIPQYCMLAFLRRRHPDMAKAHSVFLQTCFEAAYNVIRWPRLRDWGFHYQELVESHPETILWYQAKCYTISEIIHDEHGDNFLAKFLNEYPKRPRIAIKNVTLKVKQVETRLTPKFKLCSKRTPYAKHKLSSQQVFLSRRELNASKRIGV